MKSKKTFMIIGGINMLVPLYADYGSLVVTKSTIGKGYVITHKASTRSVEYHTKLADAKRIAKQLALFPIWNAPLDKHGQLGAEREKTFWRLRKKVV